MRCARMQKNADGSKRIGRIMSEKAIGKDDTLRIDFVRCIWCRLFKSKKCLPKYGTEAGRNSASHKKALSTSIREVNSMSSSESVLSQAKGMIESSIFVLLNNSRMKDSERFESL